VRIAGLAGLAVALTVLTGIGTASAAQAWEPDRAERVTLAYEIRADGVVAATETLEILHRDGPSTLRQFRLRGADRTDTSKDRVLQISNLSLSSPTGADPHFHRHEFDPADAGDDASYDSRDLLLDIRIGGYDEPDERETYVLKYEVRGALESTPTGLRFTLPGPTQELTADAVTATVTAPGGLRSAACVWFGKPCRQAKVVGGVVLVLVVGGLIVRAILRHRAAT
jgi:hypothetical protein